MAVEKGAAELTGSRNHLTFNGGETRQRFASHSPELCWNEQRPVPTATSPVDSVSAMARDIPCTVVLRLFLTSVLLAPAVTAKIPWWNIKIAHEQG